MDPVSTPSPRAAHTSQDPVVQIIPSRIGLFMNAPHQLVGHAYTQKLPFSALPMMRSVGVGRRL
jgi:hypothetical protein